MLLREALVSPIYNSIDCVLGNSVPTENSAYLGQTLLIRVSDAALRSLQSNSIFSGAAP